MRFLAFLLIAAFLPCCSHAAPWPHMPADDKPLPICETPDPTTFFKGVNIIFVNAQPTSSFENRLFDNLLDNHTPLDSFLIQVTTDSLKKVFADANSPHPLNHGVKIKPKSDPDSWEAEESNAAVVFFSISGRSEVLKGESVKLASLSLQIDRIIRGTATHRDVSQTYPFIIPDTQEELKKRIYESVFSLTKYLPAQFCASSDDPKYCEYDAPYALVYHSDEVDDRKVQESLKKEQEEKNLHK